MKEMKREVAMEKESEMKNLEEIVNLTRMALKDEKKREKWEEIRTSFGIYTEGKKGTYMVRPRFLGSKITSDNLRFLLEKAEKYGDGRLHMTTRQDLQFHGVKREDIAELLEEISTRGFFTKSTGGNGARAVTIPPATGFEKEVYDVSIHGKIITDYILEGKDFIGLPRKYKISLANKEENSLYPKVNDLGFVAQINGGIKGFRVYVAGGLGPVSANAVILREFIEEDEILYYVHAVRNLFNDYGNRKVKARARLRYVMLNMGEEKFLELCNSYVENLYKEKGDILKRFTRNLIDGYEKDMNKKKTDTIKLFSEMKENKRDLENEENIKVTEEKKNFLKDPNIVAGKNGERYGYYLRPVHGNIYPEDGGKIIGFIESLDYEVELKITSDQRFLLKNLKKGDVLKLKDLMKEYHGRNDFFNSYSCIGSTTCNLGILDTPPILEYIFKYFENEEKRELTDYLPQLSFSGCPNSCARSQIASLGFSGKRKKDGEYFTIFARGDFTGKIVKLNEVIGEIKANRIPYFLEEIAQVLKAEKIKFKDYTGSERFEELIKKYENIEVEDVDFTEFRKLEERVW